MDEHLHPLALEPWDEGQVPVRGVRVRPRRRGHRLTSGFQAVTGLTRAAGLDGRAHGIAVAGRHRDAAAEASLMVTSDKPFGRWGEVIALKGDSHRLEDRDLGRPHAATPDEA